ncbi:MAG: hypothetical protein ACKVRN_07985 [Pyrinomonadaceae bacterium]
MPRQLFVIIGTVVLTLVVVAGIGGLIYYQMLKSSPQYSLALLVDAAKRDDADEIETIVDYDAVVENFMPQVTGKAIELYGRGLPPETVQKVFILAQPLMPAVKNRARAELPRVIRDRTAKYGDVPFFAMVLGANKYLGVSVTDDVATVNSKLENRPLSMTMRWNGDRWTIVGVKDDRLATDIARKIGQEIIFVATNGGKDTAERFGVGNLSDLMRQAEEMVK